VVTLRFGLAFLWAGLFFVSCGPSDGEPDSVNEYGLEERHKVVLRNAISGYRRDNLGASDIELQEIEEKLEL